MTQHPSLAVPPDPALCARIPLGLRRVVEIGCGEGQVGAWLARRDPGCRRIATVADARHLPTAAPHYDEIHHLPPEAGAPALAGSADLVLLRGVPSDLAASVRAAAALLSPTGVLLVDLPNASHWRLAERMLAGGATPAIPAAHAVTLEGLLAAVQAAGLVALDLPQDIPEAEAARAFAGHIAPSLSALGSNEQAYLRRAAPPRWLLRAARRPAQPLAIVAHVLKPVGGVNDVRVELPLGVLASHPGVALRISQEPVLPRVAADVPRVLILQRRLLDAPGAASLVEAVRAAGWVLVQEFDDDPDHWPSIARSGHFAFRGVHAVQTSTPRLGELFSTLNSEVMVFSNTVAELPEPANFTDPSRLSLFIGALRREEDTAPYLAMLDRVLAEAEGRLRVEVVDNRPAFDALRTPHKRYWPRLAYADYRALMGRCELAFLPLRDTRFNGFKSDLKFVEAGAHGLCCLASPVVYGATIRDGETGIIVHDPDGLAATLRGLLAAPGRAQMIGAAAREWVRGNRMMAGQAAQRLAWYRSLWDRRAVLDAALVGRLRGS
jgi:glycosyltransferase involved in cell wall biosynthesis